MRVVGVYRSGEVGAIQDFGGGENFGEGRKRFRERLHPMTRIEGRGSRGKVGWKGGSRLRQMMGRMGGMKGWRGSGWSVNGWRAAIWLAALLTAVQACGYSVLTHEQLVDLAWNDSIRPLLLARFPGTTDEQLKEAHAYAYGGSAIQDMGYYPFGKEFFSDLTHYVRSGDFVAWMLTHARTVDEYAFAIGALSHYLGDSIGHAEAINPATAMEFPRLRERFGRSVTYDESPHGHIRTEFAFDVGELSAGALAPPGYLRSIGLRVPRKFLEEAFASVYGFDVHELWGHSHSAVRSYRSAVRRFIPAFAEAEVVLHRRHFPAPVEDEAHRIFAERVARTNDERKWTGKNRGPGVKAHLLAGVVLLAPKIGPISDLAIKIPNPNTQELYLRSVNHTGDRLRELLEQFHSDPRGEVRLANIDLDKGDHVKRGDYALADKTYAHLLARLTSRSTAGPARAIPGDVKENILEYYGAGTGTESARVKKRLESLKGMRVGEAN